MSAQRDAAIPDASRSDAALVVSFRLAKPYPLLNRMLRMHWRARKVYQRRVMHEIMEAIGFRRPERPFDFALVRIERHSVGTPDRDGLIGGAKPVIDCLTTPTATQALSPFSKNRVRNPLGLGFVVDDGPDRILLEVVHVKATRSTQGTVVVITGMQRPKNDAPAARAA